ncbi:unnamed protein product [Acanthoscelides obtectus]|uniref:Uncharacterized protein n=1 Tax=Acanthoscelides obtectus TaxID=200917 RepID=A0A9P0LQ17_ACAOB|nr:unnamed protein product [Acanthoscelides obtectus]CAK1683240.1 hypothetical protein AOBTE_LOCUS34157 [Acanthoscelides obtectus]
MEFVLIGIGSCCPPKVIHLVSSDTEFIKKLLNASAASLDDAEKTFPSLSEIISGTCFFVCFELAILLS